MSVVKKKKAAFSVSSPHPNFAVWRRSRAEVAYRRLKISLSWLHVVFNNHQLLYKYHFFGPSNPFERLSVS
jgi:hypothetical protein